MTAAALAGPPVGPPRSRPCPRLVALSDEARLAGPEAQDRIEALARAGCPAVLLRPGSMPARSFHDLAVRARAICGEAGTELWIGDRADVALAVGADGVQLSARGLSLAGARRVLGEALRLGRSAHAADETARAAVEGADHVVLGTIFATASHLDVSPAGVGLISEARRAIEATGRRVPILAIGGMTAERATRVVAAGAWGVAALSALWDADDPAVAVSAFLAALGGELSARALD